MKCFPNILFILISIWIVPLLVAGTTESVFNPHNMPMQEQSSQCFNCHAGSTQTAKRPMGTRIPTFVGDGIRICTSCHESAVVKHMVGQRPSFNVPYYLPLDEQGRITCLTCHYTHGPLRSNKPWVDVSWIERMSNSDRLSKTFLLRHHNRNGSLCLACHDE